MKVHEVYGCLKFIFGFFIVTDEYHWSYHNTLQSMDFDDGIWAVGERQARVLRRLHLQWSYLHAGGLFVSLSRM